MGVLGYPKGSALELLDGTLKLRHCTDLFTKRFLPWSLPRVGSGIGKRDFMTPGIPLDAGGDREKGSGLSIRLVQAQLLMSFRIQGIQRQGEGREVGVLRNLFPRLGVG